MLIVVKIKSRREDLNGAVKEKHRGTNGYS